jgi:hypothetical protein
MSLAYGANKIILKPGERGILPDLFTFPEAAKLLYTSKIDGIPNMFLPEVEGIASGKVGCSSNRTARTTLLLVHRSTN